MSSINIENYVPVVKQQGLNTDKAADFDSTLNVQGATTLQNTLTVTGQITGSSSIFVTGGTIGPLANEATTTTDALGGSESGKTIFLNSATGFVTTLPAPAAGYNFRFIIGATAPTSGNHTIVTSSSSNVIYGNVVVNGAEVAGSAEDTISFVASTALPGDWVQVVADGTNWYVSGQAAATGAVTLTQAS